MLWLLVFGLLLLLLLQAMRSLSGLRLALAGMLCLSLLWPMAKWFLKGEVAHQTLRVVTEKITEDKDAPKEKQNPKESFGCRLWHKVDHHKKNGLVRDHIRTVCDKEAP